MVSALERAARIVSYQPVVSFVSSHVTRASQTGIEGSNNFFSVFSHGRIPRHQSSSSRARFSRHKVLMGKNTFPCDDGLILAPFLTIYQMKSAGRSPRGHHQLSLRNHDSQDAYVHNRHCARKGRERFKEPLSRLSSRFAASSSPGFNDVLSPNKSSRQPTALLFKPS